MVDKNNLGELLWQGFLEKQLKEPPANIEEYIRDKYIFLTGVLVGLQSSEELVKMEKSQTTHSTFAQYMLGNIEIKKAYVEIKQQYEESIKKG